MLLTCISYVIKPLNIVQIPFMSTPVKEKGLSCQKLHNHVFKLRADDYTVISWVGMAMGRVFFFFFVPIFPIRMDMELVLSGF